MSSACTVVFVCEHGAAKSVIAAAYLPGLARVAGREVRALARGTDPPPAHSAPAIAGLRAAGIATPDRPPRRPTADELAAAAMVVSFGPELERLVPEHVPLRYWEDVPAVSDGFEAARDAIVARLADLLGDLPDA